MTSKMPQRYIDRAGVDEKDILRYYEQHPQPTFQPPSRSISEQQGRGF